MPDHPSSIPTPGTAELLRGAPLVAFGALIVFLMYAHFKFIRAHGISEPL